MTTSLQSRQNLFQSRAWNNIRALMIRIDGAIRMLRQYLVGATVSVCNIAIHALVMVIVIRVTRSQRRVNGFD
jgi:hypothetical protein